MKALMSRIRSIKRPRGAILVLAAFALVAFMGLVALAVDLGVIAMARGQLKTVADGAALAGARQLVTDNRLKVNYSPTAEAAAARSSSKKARGDSGLKSWSRMPWASTNSGCCKPTSGQRWKST